MIRGKKERENKGASFLSKQVIVYSTNDCIECTYVKRKLEEEGISFEVRDVSTSKQYQKELEQFGFLGVPVTVFGTKVVKGFNLELQEIIDGAKNKRGHGGKKDGDISI